MESKVCSSQRTTSVLSMLQCFDEKSWYELCFILKSAFSNSALLFSFSSLNRSQTHNCDSKYRKGGSMKTEMSIPFYLYNTNGRKAEYTLWLSIAERKNSISRESIIMSIYGSPLNEEHFNAQTDPKSKYRM